MIILLLASGFGGKFQSLVGPDVDIKSMKVEGKFPSEDYKHIKMLFKILDNSFQPL